MNDALAQKIREWETEWPSDFSLKDFVSPNQPILVYGAGRFGQKTARILTSHGFKVNAFIDRRAATIKEVAGIPCYTLDDATAQALICENTVLVIGVFNFEISIHRLIEELKAKGIRKIITPLQLYEVFSVDLGNQFWLAPRSFYRDRLNQIKKINAFWADEESRNCYLQTLQLRIDNDWHALDLPDQNHQYFPPSLSRYKKPLNFVDGGAFTGDTISSFLNEGYQFNQIWAFEPDLKNVTELSHRARAKFPNLNLSIWPCGLSKNLATNKFFGNDGAASCLGEGDTEIPLVALDQILMNQPIDLIKLDIEGAEEDALEGMKTTICCLQPSLAICVYHQPNHLFSIVEKLHHWQLGYRFYLRYHQFNGFDTVLYARK